MALRVLPISRTTWNALVDANFRAVQNGWAKSGVFAAGIGPKYERDNGIFYIGKSAGPLGGRVGSSTDQLSSSNASTQWMITRQNKSAFWQFIEKLDPSRLTLAWSNVCKMDRKGGAAPPSPSQWAQVAEVCIEALTEELDSLSPFVSIFATSNIYAERTILERLGYVDAGSSEEGTVHHHPNGRWAIVTRHPQGWPNARREIVLAQIRQILNRR